MSSPSPELKQVRARLVSHFANTTSATNQQPQNDGWSALWDAGDFLPWDKGLPNPALEDVLAQRQDLIGSPLIVDRTTNKQRRKRALVPGCGRGYDVLLLASFGYDAYGLDVSASAVLLCEEHAKKHADAYTTRNESVGRGTAKFVAADFFVDDWLKGLSSDGGEDVETFELLYDYTFLSVMPPSLRPAWALRYSQLLSSTPESCLICLEFPSTKPPSTRGPPYGLPEKVYVSHLSRPGETLPYDEEGDLLEEQVPKGRSPTGLVRVGRWQPERTHEIGRGIDWLSVWRHPT